MTGYITMAAALITAWTAGALAAAHCLHMFQLNSYKPNVQAKWIRDNAGRELKLTAPALAALAGGLFGWIGHTICIVAFVFTAWLCRPRQAKKPLVYTARIKRMLFTLSVPMLLFTVLTFFSGWFFAAFGLYIAAMPWVVLAANRTNAPVEQSINRKYIEEAKDIIAGMPHLRVVGVTGSYGKTSVKFYLGKILSARYNVLVTPESYNTTLGVVRTIRESMRATHDIFVCEMGARNVGDIREICEIVRPQYGIITSIGPQHLESFKTIENIVATKFELADSLPNDGTVFLNMSNKYIADRKVSCRVVGYGSEKSEWFAEDISVSAQGSRFTIRDPDGKKWAFRTKLIGEHNVQNITGAIAAAYELGVPMRDIVIQVWRLESVPHRLNLVRGAGKTFIDDAYNSNPAGAKAALDTLCQFDGLKILVTPGMVELGERQYELNYEFGKQAADVCDHVFLVGRKQTEPIQKGLEEAGYANVTVCDTLQQALAGVDGIDADGREKFVLLENDLPDNY